MARRKCSTTGKDRFPSSMEANLAIADVQLNAKHHRKGKYREEPTRAYCCEFCRGWHMTSSESRNAEALTA